MGEEEPARVVGRSREGSQEGGTPALEIARAAISHIGSARRLRQRVRRPDPESVRRLLRIRVTLRSAVIPRSSRPNAEEFEMNRMVDDHERRSKYLLAAKSHVEPFPYRWAHHGIIESGPRPGEQPP